MAECGCELDEAAELERKTLRILLVINGAMFFFEALAGWWGQSTGLLADSLDMFADASVYGISLYAVGRSLSLQAGAATASGVVHRARHHHLSCRDPRWRSDPARVQGGAATGLIIVSAPMLIDTMGAVFNGWGRRLAGK